MMTVISNSVREYTEAQRMAVSQEISYWVDDAEMDAAMSNYEDKDVQTLAANLKEAESTLLAMSQSGDKKGFRRQSKVVDQLKIVIAVKNTK